MVPDHAISIGIGHRFNISGVKVDEIIVISLLNKYILPVVTSVEDVIITTWLEWSWAGHIAYPLAKTLKVSETFRV